MKEKEKLIKYKIFLESEKIRLAKVEIKKLKKELEIEREYTRRLKN